MPESWGITPKAGGTLIVRTHREPTQFNPNYELVAEAEFYVQTYQKLVDISDISFEVIPSLAQSWEISADYKTFTFYLHENVKFHDGTPMTSADVKWSYESVLENQGYFFSQLEHIDKIETPDDYTVIFKLSETDSTFLNVIGRVYAPVVLPKHLYEGTDPLTNPFNQNPVGTGPFKFKEWIKGSHFTLEANKDYYLGRPFLDEIIFKYIPNDAVYQLQLKTGQVHFGIFSPSLSAISDLEKESHIVTDGFVEPGVILWVGFNLAREPYDDLRVRKAIGHAIDVYDLNEKAWYGLIYPNPYVLGQKGFPEWSFNPDAKMPEYNPAESERLLDEAGLPRGSDGVRFSAKLVTWTSMEAPVFAEVLKEYLGDVGIEIEIEVYEFGTYKEVVINNREYDISLGGGNHGPDPSNTELFFGSTGYRNSMGYVNEEVDALYAEGKAGITIEERQPAYWRIQEILAEELPRITVEEFAFSMPRHSDFKGYWFEEPYHEMAGGNRRLDMVWWEGGEEISPIKSITPSPGDDIDSRVEAIEGSLGTVTNQVNSLSSQVESLTSKLESLTEPTPASNTFSYVAIVIAVVAMILPFYFKDQK